MREIKFRVWDKAYKIYLPSDIYHIHNRTSFNSFGVMRTNWKDYREGEYFYDSAQVLEQFTGLKDKRGKDIYEGDIICLDGSKNRMWKIVYSGCSFIGEPLETNNFIDMMTLKNNNYLQFDVIGNIHETIELIRA